MHGVLYVVAVFILFGKSFCYTTDDGSSKIFNDGFEIFKPTNISSKCENAGFCIDYYGAYPIEHIEKKMRAYKSFFRHTVEKQHTNLSFSYGDTVDKMCLSQDEVMEFKVAKSLDNQWYFTVNTPNYPQGVSGQLCTEENMECFYVESAYDSICKQETSSLYLYALSHDGDIFRDQFFSPSCCSCQVLINKKNYNQIPETK